MEFCKVRNKGKKTVVMSIAGAPGQKPTVYEVPPGGECELPEGYCRGEGSRPAYIHRRSRDLEVVGDMPKEAPTPQPSPASPLSESSMAIMSADEIPSQEVQAKKRKTKRERLSQRKKLEE